MVFAEDFVVYCKNLTIEEEEISFIHSITPKIQIRTYFGNDKPTRTSELKQGQILATTHRASGQLLKATNSLRTTPPLISNSETAPIPKKILF